MLLPVFANKFQIGELGCDDTELIDITELLTADVSVDTSDETWNTYQGEGWQSSMATSKSASFAYTVKCDYGSPLYTFLLTKMMANGTAAYVRNLWTMADGKAKIDSNGTIKVTKLGTGSTTEVGEAEFEVSSNGKPIVTIIA
jgi:hypothetical protein